MQRVFSRGEDPYGYLSRPYERSRLVAMEEALGDRRYQRALEVGCAEGAFTERLAPRAGLVTALDISPTALERARGRLKGRSGVEFAEADLRAWSPSTDEGYDLIILGDLLYYLDKPLVRSAFEGTFKRLASWLRPGGRLILAHAFAGSQELLHRQGFRERFERQGLKLVSEKVVGPAEAVVQCLLSVLERS